MLLCVHFIIDAPSAGCLRHMRNLMVTGSHTSILLSHPAERGVVIFGSVDLTARRLAFLTPCVERANTQSMSLGSRE